MFQIWKVLNTDIQECGKCPGMRTYESRNFGFPR